MFPLSSAPLNSTVPITWSATMVVSVFLSVIVGLATTSTFRAPVSVPPALGSALVARVPWAAVA
jgi:hypothetical protein